MITLQHLYDVEERAMRAKAEAARYRAALEQILAYDARRYHLPTQHTSGYATCKVCGRHMCIDQRLHADTCPFSIADRALKGKGE